MDLNYDIGDIGMYNNVLKGINEFRQNRNMCLYIVSEQRCISTNSISQHTIFQFLLLFNKNLNHIDI